MDTNLNVKTIFQTLHKRQFQMAISIYEPEHVFEINKYLVSRR